MKCFVAILVAFLPLAAPAENLAARFAWRQPITGPLVTGQFYRVKVTPEMFNASRAFPNDLRIMDGDGKEWPYAMWADEARSDLRNVRARTPAEASGATKECRWQNIEVVEGEHNQVIVQVSGHHFIRRAEVFGSENGNRWQMLGSGRLVDFAEPLRLSSRVIRYPSSTLPLLQIRVYPMVIETVEDIAVGRVAVAFATEDPGELEVVPARKVGVEPADAPPAGAQVAVLDLGARNQPVERITVSARGDYAAALRVYGRNEATNRWRLAGEGIVYRVDDDPADQLALKWFSSRFMKVELYPMGVESLKDLEIRPSAVPRYLIFEAQSGPRPVLYCGAAGMEPPAYELNRRKLEPVVATAPAAALGRSEGLAAWPAVPARRPRGAIIAVGVGLAVVLLVWRLAYGPRPRRRR